MSVHTRPLLTERPANEAPASPPHTSSGKWQGELPTWWQGLGSVSENPELDLGETSYENGLI